MKFTLNAQPLEITQTANGYAVAFEGQTYPIEIVSVDPASGRIAFRVGGVVQSAYVSFDGAKRWTTVGGKTMALVKSSGGRRGARPDSAAGLTAPMPGQVRSVIVSAGEAVKKGQTLLTLEAMKMEIKIHAAADGKIKTLHVQPGQAVEREQILVEMED